MQNSAQRHVATAFDDGNPRHGSSQSLQLEPAARVDGTLRGKVPTQHGNGRPVQAEPHRDDTAPGRRSRQLRRWRPNLAARSATVAIATGIGRDGDMWRGLGYARSGSEISIGKTGDTVVWRCSVRVSPGGAKRATMRPVSSACQYSCTPAIQLTSSQCNPRCRGACSHLQSATCWMIHPRAVPTQYPRTAHALRGYVAPTAAGLAWRDRRSVPPADSGRPVVTLHRSSVARVLITVSQKSGVILSGIVVQTMYRCVRLCHIVAC